MQSNLYMVKPQTAAPAPSEDIAALAREYLHAHPASYLGFWTAMAALGVIALACADVLAIYNVLSQRYTDAFGNPTGETTALLAASCATLVAYVLIGVLWAQGSRLARAAAVGLYGCILAMLALTMAPLEIAHFREQWVSLGGSSPLTMAGAEDEAPAWFLGICLAIYAVAYSLFGLVFLWAKSWLTHWLGLWRCRSEAKGLLAHADALAAQQDRVKHLAGLVEHFSSDRNRNEAVQAALRTGLLAYTAPLNQAIAASQATLNNVQATKAEKKAAHDALLAAQSCLDASRAVHL